MVSINISGSCKYDQTASIFGTKGMIEVGLFLLCYIRLISGVGGVATLFYVDGKSMPEGELQNRVYLISSTVS